MTSPSDITDYGAYAAIAAMALASALMRLGGYWLMSKVKLTARVQRMLDALPGSVVLASVLPVVAKGGPVVMLAVAGAMLMMIARRNDFLAVATGMGIAALARGLGLGG